MQIVHDTTGETVSDSEEGMFSAKFELTTALDPLYDGQSKSAEERLNSLEDEEEEADLTFTLEDPEAKPSLDLLERVDGLFRLLELVTDRGANGAGE
jgi:hypothetical protein